MGRPPSNGGPSFRFNPAEIVEMEAILQAHKTQMPAREVLVTLAEKFSNSEERKGKIEVQMKQVWNWFQNRRYAIRAKAGKSPGKLNMTQTDPTMVKGIPQPTLPHAASSATIRFMPQPQQLQHPSVLSDAVRTFPQAPQNTMSFSVQSAGRVADNSQMEYEAKSARDGAWYDVSTFLSHRSPETGDPEVLVRFAGFGAEEDEWVNVHKNVRQRSLPCEASECVAVLPADLILCFQEGKEQALYFDAHVLDAQRRRHDVRGCRCRFLVRYDHDQSEEIVALRKICRRPETDYRLQQLHAANESHSVNHNKNGTNNNNNIHHTVSTLRVYPPAEVQPKQPAAAVEAPPKRQKVESAAVPAPPPETPTVLAAQPRDVPQDQHKVDHVLPASSEQPSLDPQKVEITVSVASDEVPLELQKVQPVIPEDPSGEVSEEPRVVGPLVPPSAETSPPLAASEPPPTHEGKSEVGEEEPVVCSSSVEVHAELPQVQSASAIEDKAKVQTELPPPNAIEKASETKADVAPELHEVQPPSAIEALESKAEVQEELPEVQSASAVEAKAEVQTELPEVVQPEAVETKAEEVPPELPEVQPPNAIEALGAVVMKAEVQAELPQVQPASEPDTNAEIPVELPEVQPASAIVLEAMETKAEVPAELHEVQPANASAMEAKDDEVPAALPEVQPASANAMETKDEEVPAELPQVQPATAQMETEPEVPAELREVQPASAMETEAEVPAELPEVQAATGSAMEIEPVVAVCINDSNVAEEAMDMEAEIEPPKVSEMTDTNDENDNTVVTGDMEEV